MEWGLEKEDRDLGCCGTNAFGSGGVPLSG